MVTYYISYGDPEPGSPGRRRLLILAVLLVLLLIPGIAYGVYALAANDDDPQDSPDPTPVSAGASDLPSAAPTPLSDALSSLYGQDNTSAAATAGFTDSNLLFMVAAGPGLSGSLTEVKTALLQMALPCVDPDAADCPLANSRAALVPFTAVPPSLPPLPEPDRAIAPWLKSVDNLQSQRRPAYIYDAVGAAHDALRDASHDSDSRHNVIVLLTGGNDGGLAAVDPAQSETCAPDVTTAPGEVCSPMLETLAIDPAALVPCPPELAVASGVVCLAVTAGATIIAHHPVNPDAVRPCPPNLGGPDHACADLTVTSRPFHPDAVQPCPPDWPEPDQACVAFTSELTRDELLAKLVSSNVPNLVVHIIALDAAADHDSLKLLTEATGGRYLPVAP